MLLNMVTPASLAQLRGQLQVAAAAEGVPCPTLAVWLTCAVDPEPEAFEQLRHAIVGYLSAPGYAEMMSAAGYAELVAFAKTRPHPREILAATPNELISKVGLVGDYPAIAARIEEYRSAGADEICLVPATAGDPGGTRTLETMCQLF